MIRELEVALLLFGACVVLRCEWMLDGSGSEPRTLCPLSRSWMAFVVKNDTLSCWFGQISMGGVQLLFATLLYRRQKSFWNRWTQPNLALASKIQYNRVCRKKTKKLIYLTTIVSPFVTHLQEMKQRCSGLCNFDVSQWQNPPGNMMDSHRVPDPYCIHVHINHFHKPPPLMPYFKRSDRGLSRMFSVLCSGYKSCVCRQLRGPDGMRIIWFINGGLEPRLHGVKGACKQLNVGNSKVVFNTGTKDKLVWTLVKQANNTTHPLV